MITFSQRVAEKEGTMMQEVEYRILNHKWTQADANTVAAEFYRDPSNTHSARLLLSTLCYDGRPRPFLRCNDLGNNATTLGDVAALRKQVSAALREHK